MGAYRLLRPSVFAFMAVAMAMVAGCATEHNPRVPDASNLVIGGNLLTDDEIIRLEDGRRLYLNQCVRCHSLTWPDEMSYDKWKMLFTRHRGITPLDNEKYSNLANYVLRVSYCFETRKCSIMPVKSH